MHIIQGPEDLINRSSKPKVEESDSNEFYPRDKELIEPHEEIERLSLQN